VSTNKALETMVDTNDGVDHHRNKRKKNLKMMKKELFFIKLHKIYYAPILIPRNRFVIMATATPDMPVALQVYMLLPNWRNKCLLMIYMLLF
jgi:hypothetical protein